ncbi:hypothetical protein H5A33_03385 [Pectobacterium brasiliense]|uniref:hypothetical protein n=1 Tax=Pectobacterium brasiliense TaxID=180957 RepID=UPI0019692EF4|nr:hypothetical protein [Pectobacterium brasiliense]MBN3253672.1 hypothetical protein [Pectobacterium brasiliense]
MKDIDILEMKNCIEQLFSKKVWSPTENQLINIRDGLAKLPNNPNEKDVVNSIYYQALVTSGMEGLDTSVAMQALHKIKEIQNSVKVMEKQNDNTRNNNSTTGKN